jgi:DNA repair exonuclease SbcCD nuclease subunit
MKLLHCADLHLSRSEESYSLAVLDEIVAHAARLGAETLLFVGDVFDSWADMEALRGDFRKRVDGLPASVRIVLLPGNHEFLRAPAGAKVGRLDFGRAAVVETMPFEAIPLAGDADLIALPYRRNYSDYRDWRVPEKRKLRVVAVHAPVAGLNFLGPSDEEEAGAVDPDLFAFLGADYGALGHIHAAGSRRSGGATLAYPGSARVWRAGEEGPRTVLFVDAASPPAVPEKIAIRSAGRFRRVPLSLGLDGSLPDPEASFGDFEDADSILIELSGAVENERLAVAAEESITAILARRARVLSVDRSGIIVLEGISTNALASRFLREWESREPERASPEYEAWLRSRTVGLKKIKEVLESRK